MNSLHNPVTSWFYLNNEFIYSILSAKKLIAMRSITKPGLSLMFRIDMIGDEAKVYKKHRKLRKSVFLFKDTLRIYFLENWSFLELY